MKKQYAIVLILFLFSGILFGQKHKDLSIEFGELHKEKLKHLRDEIIAHHEGNTYVGRLKLRRIGSYKYYIDRYDKRMNHRNSKEIDMDLGVKNRNFEFYIYSNDRLYLISSARDAGVAKLYKQEIMLPNVEPEVDPQVLITTKLSKKSWDETVEYKISKDGSKIAILYDKPNKNKDENEMDVLVFDENMKELWQKKITLPYTDKLSNFKSVTVSNQGNVYIKNKVYNDKLKDKRKGEVNYRFEVRAYYDQGERLEVYPVYLDDKFLSGLSMAIDKSEDLICSGFYSNEESGQAVGAFFLKIDKESKEIIKKSSEEFSANFITTGLKAGKKNRKMRQAKRGKDVEMSNYRLQDIVQLDNGDYILVAEMYREYQNIVESSSGVRSYIDMINFGSIIVMYMNSEGELKWYDKILKDRHANKELVTDGPTYAFMRGREKFHIIYNDHYKNFKKKGGEVISYSGRHKSTANNVVSYNKKGKVDHVKFWDQKVKKFVMIPPITYTTQENELFALGNWKKKRGLIKLTLR